MSADAAGFESAVDPQITCPCYKSFDEFIDVGWLKSLSKPFYMLNHRTGEALYVGSYSAKFNTVNQFPGSDPADGPSFSVRVDGHFTEEFRSLIPSPGLNPASAPAL